LYADNGIIIAATERWNAPMAKLNDMSRVLGQDSPLIAVIEMGQS
jgi:hypothetical protein